MAMRRVGVGVIGTGWIGEIRARVCAEHPLVESLYLAEIDPARLARVAKATGARTATTDYHKLLARPDVDLVFVSTTPETTQYPITRACLLAPKHTFLEKLMGLELKEADEMMALAKDAGVKLTIGYTSASTRSIVLSTMQKGMVLPLSTMPGEQVAHVYQGPMQAETELPRGRGPEPARPGDARAGAAGHGGDAGGRPLGRAQPADLAPASGLRSDQEDRRASAGPADASRRSTMRAASVARPTPAPVTQRPHRPGPSRRGGWAGRAPSLSSH